MTTGRRLLDPATGKRVLDADGRALIAAGENCDPDCLTCEPTPGGSCVVYRRCPCPGGAPNAPEFVTVVCGTWPVGTQVFHAPPPGWDGESPYTHTRVHQCFSTECDPNATGFPDCYFDCYTAEYPYTTVAFVPPLISAPGLGGSCSAQFPPWDVWGGCSPCCDCLEAADNYCDDAPPPTVCPETCPECGPLYFLDTPPIETAAFCPGGPSLLVFPAQTIPLPSVVSECGWFGQNDFTLHHCLNNNAASAGAVAFCEVHPEQGRRWKILVRYAIQLVGSEEPLECVFILIRSPGWPTCPEGDYTIDPTTLPLAGCFPGEGGWRLRRAA